MNTPSPSGFSDGSDWESLPGCGKAGAFSRYFRAEGVDYRLHLEILSDGLVHVSYVIDHVWDTSKSYGVSPDFLSEPVAVKNAEDVDSVELMTEKLIIRIRKSDLSLSFAAAEDGTLLSEDRGRLEHHADAWSGDHMQRLRKGIKWNELFFGMGDKPCRGNLRGRKFEFWGADHYAFHDNSDPLYKNIPFFIGLADQRCYGIFLDNTGRSSCDFGIRENDQLVLEVPGGRMNYFFFHESSPLEIIASYTRLTGLPALPPAWALGYQQSRWSYYPESVVRNVVGRMRETRIPCDAIYLDIHHLDGNRVFTWDKERFPDPAGMIGELKDEGIRIISIVNPGIKIEEGNRVWGEGLEKGYYCRRHNGAVLEGKSWSEICHFPDFTRGDVRNWWAGLLREDVGVNGVSGIWADMNEPSIFPDQTFPADTRHDCDGNPCSHARAHNIYGHCMAKSCREGMLRFGEGKRPFILSRSGYAGMQRFAATWTGDNCSTWEHLGIANAQCQRLASSGISFCGSDVGGFLEYPTPELFCRWMQLGAFHLLFRNHSSGDYGGQEPWVFGQEITDHVRYAVEYRYRLLPYFYTQFYRYSVEGMPILRPLALQCSQEEDTSWRETEFFVGDHLYVVPVLEPQVEECTFYVPSGTWYSLWNDKPLGQHGREETVPVSLENIPVFVRGGAVLPQWPVQQYVGQIEKPDLTLHLWWSENDACESELYEDAGDGEEYRSGDFLLHHFSFASHGNQSVLTCRREGEGKGFHGSQTLVLHAFPGDFRSYKAVLDGREVSIRPGERKCLLIDLPDDFEKLELIREMAP